MKTRIKLSNSIEIWNNIENMFGKKLPLKQPPPQVYEEEYSEE